MASAAMVMILSGSGTPRFAVATFGREIFLGFGLATGVGDDFAIGF
jgi:hypothetical protein